MDLIQEFGKKAWSCLKARLGDESDKWTPEEQALVKKCAEDAAKVALMAASGIDIGPEKAQISAQFANIKVAGEASVAKVFWSVVSDLLKVAVSLVKK